MIRTLAIAALACLLSLPVAAGQCPYFVVRDYAGKNPRFVFLSGTRTTVQARLGPMSAETVTISIYDCTDAATLLPRTGEPQSAVNSANAPSAPQQEPNGE
jgi:hypothetical protein